MSMQAWLQRSLQQETLYKHSAPTDVLGERNRVLVVTGVGLLVWLANLAPSRLDALGLKELEVDPGGVNRGLAVLLGLYLAYYLIRWLIAYRKSRRDHVLMHPVRPATHSTPYSIESRSSSQAAFSAIHNGIARANFWAARSILFLSNNRVEIGLSGVVAIAALGLLLADSTLDKNNLPAQARLMAQGGTLRVDVPRVEVANGPYASGAFTVAILDTRTRSCQEQIPACHKPSFLDEDSDDSASVTAQTGTRPPSSYWWLRSSQWFARLFHPATFESRDERRYCELVWTLAHALSKCSRLDQPVEVEVRGFALQRGSIEGACPVEIANARAHRVYAAIRNADLSSAASPAQSRAPMRVSVKASGSEDGVSKGHDLAFTRAAPIGVTADRGARRVEIFVRNAGSCELQSRGAFDQTRGI